MCRLSAWQAQGKMKNDRQILASGDARKSTPRPGCRPLAAALLCLCAMLCLPAAGSDEASVPALYDQFAQVVSLQDGAGQVQVAIVVSAKRLRRIKPWEVALRERFPDLVILRVADIPGENATYERVCRNLAQTAARGCRGRYRPGTPLGAKFMNSTHKCRTS